MIQNVPWSEEYQVQFLEMYHAIFDRLDAVVSEHVWSSANFQTSLQVFRVDGNNRGSLPGTGDRKLLLLPCRGGGLKWIRDTRIKSVLFKLHGAVLEG